MSSITSPKQIKEIMEAYDLNFVKRFGQNFIIDENILQKIANSAEISSEDTVIEIGPGLGSLTSVLSPLAKKVISIEIDKKLIPVLNDLLKEYENIEIINNDVLKIDFNKLVKERDLKRIKIIGNLPYYITSAIIMQFLESDLEFDSLTFLIQKEVAERIVAKPGNKTYGALSVIAQYFADAEILFEVKNNVFIPKPKVDSAVIRLKRKKKIIEVDKKKYFEVIRAGFQNRRKTLVNALSNNLKINKEVIKIALEELGFNPNIRAEDLSPEDFKNLTEKLS